ncbi:52 kDa repressor of the inhibitor of the protein kinase [Nematostella vectensis]|uniref:52 kDa repressor of the inhibitor of the protein kinase n=1 Tax=Nematostella vectensis TaxID=45351 RepID=UPI0020775BB4|nr:52 kDa repressor of the inhibitor of the protein kinase [Nematostella vectensis]
METREAPKPSPSRSHYGWVCRNPTEPREENRLASQREQLAKNRAKIKSILRPLLFCAKYGLPLRGHRDHGDLKAGENATSRVFRGLLRLLSGSGDVTLQEHIQTASRNANYFSPRSQNELLDCLREEVEEIIISEIKAQEFGAKYCIMADEVTDISNWAHLGIAVRYRKDDKPVERLLGFESCSSITGEAISNTIITFLKNKGLDVLQMRGQNYDGAALVHSLKIPMVFSMMENLAALDRFFNNSPKRTRALEYEIEKFTSNLEESMKKKRVKALCQTRWVKKHQIFQDVHDMYESIVNCLDQMVEDNTLKWETLTEASGFLNTVTSSPFLAAFETVRFSFRYTHDLATLLQGKSLEILSAFEVVRKAEALREALRDSDMVFASICAEMAKKAKVANAEISILSTLGLALIPQHLDHLLGGKAAELGTHYWDDLPNPEGFNGGSG